MRLIVEEIYHGNHVPRDDIWINQVDTDREDWSLEDGEMNMPRSEAKVAVAQVRYRPENNTQSARPSMTIAWFPLSAWGFALRTWGALMVALYAAFWLQLDNAWSAAVTVSILSMQTRGQTYQRAVYWVLAAIIGVAASLVIGGLFPQSRELFVIGLAVTLGLCVYAANLWTRTGRTPLYCAVIRLPRSLCRRSTRRRAFSRLGSTEARRSWWELRRSPWSTCSPPRTYIRV